MPVSGGVIAGERKPVILTDSGKTIIKLSNNANTIEKSKYLITQYDVIDVNIKTNIIVVAAKNKTYIKTLSSDFSQEYDYAMANDIVDVAVSQCQDNFYWVLFSNQLKQIRLESGVATIISSVSIPFIGIPKGVKHDYHGNGAVVYSNKEIFKINDLGTAINWQNSSFEDIVDIAVSQEISKIYTEQFKYDLLSTKSMAFDSFRNKMWWLANDEKPKLCSVDLSNYSASLVDMELSEIIFKS